MAFTDWLNQGFNPNKDMQETGWFGRTMGGGDSKMTPYEQEMAGRMRFANAASGLGNLFFTGRRGDELRVANQDFRKGLSSQAEALAKTIAQRQEREKAGNQAPDQAQANQAAPIGSTIPTTMGEFPQPAQGGNPMYGALEGYRDVNVSNQVMGGLPATQNIRPGLEYPGMTAAALAPPAPSPDTGPQPLDPILGMKNTNTLQQLFDPGDPSRVPPGAKVKNRMTYADGTVDETNVVLATPNQGEAGQPARQADKPNVGTQTADALAGGPGASGPFTGGVDYSPMAYGLGLPVGAAIDPAKDALDRQLTAAQIAVQQQAARKALVPETRTLEEGDEKVTYEQQADGSWKEIARTPKWEPDKIEVGETRVIQEGLEKVTYERQADGSWKQIGRGPAHKPSEGKEQTTEMQLPDGKGGWSKPKKVLDSNVQARMAEGWRVAPEEDPVAKGLTGSAKQLYLENKAQGKANPIPTAAEIGHREYVASAEGFKDAEEKKVADETNAFYVADPKRAYNDGFRIDWKTGQTHTHPVSGKTTQLEPFTEGMGKRSQVAHVFGTAHMVKDGEQLYAVLTDNTPESQQVQADLGSLSGGFYNETKDEGFWNQGIEAISNRFQGWLLGKGLSGTAAQPTLLALSKMQKMTSDLLKQMSGTAVSAQEFERAIKFLPQPGDTVDVMRAKLLMLMTDGREEILDILAGYRKHFDMSSWYDLIGEDPFNHLGDSTIDVQSLQPKSALDKKQPAAVDSNRESAWSNASPEVQDLRNKYNLR